jgi:autotransporter-associated beta strand protein
MSVVRARKNQKLVRCLGLLASASLMSFMMADDAQAACVVNSPTGAPLNNLPNDADVNCTGVTNGQTIAANGVSADIDIDAGGAFNNGVVTINGPDTRVFFGVFGGSATTVQNLVLTTTPGQAATNVRFFNADVANLTAQIDGQQTTLRFLNGTDVTATPGNIQLNGATNNPGPGGNGILSLEGGSTVTAIGAGNGSYLLTTGAGNESVFVIDSSLTAAADGLLISTGAGSDLINIWGNSTLAGGSGTLSIDGGADFDRIRFRAGSTAIIHDVDVSNVEEAVFESFSATAPLIMRGTANYSTVFIGGGGTTRFDDIAALGANNAAVQVTPGSTLELNANAISTLNHVFSGSGTIRQTEGVNILNGNSSGFSGTYIIDFNRTILGNSNALGTANIVNNSLLFFADFALANDISGTGQVIVTGVGNSRLSGANTFSGGLDIRGGVLDVASVNNLGTGTVTSSTAGAVLAVGNTTNEVLSNNLTGNLALVMGGTGILDLTGTNSYALGTLINNGAVRVDSFARLGTGQVIANSGGALILNYNGAGQLLQTAPFMTGGGSFIKEGTGDVVMSQTSTYTGGTIIRAGRIGLNNGNALGTGNIEVNGGAELGIGNITLANSVTGAGNIVKTANNGATLTGNNSGFTGLLDVQDGWIEASDGSALGSGTVSIASGSYVTVNSAGVDTVIAASLTGAGDLELASSNRFTLTGSNSNLSGVVFVNSGTLQIEGSQNIGSTARIDLTGATSVLDLSTNALTTLSNDVTGLGRIVKTGSGTVSLIGANTYSGGTDIQQGAIRVTDISFLGTGAITVQAGAALDLSIAGQQTLNQSVTGAGILRKSDVGELTLLSNSLTGGVDIVGGRVIVNTAAALGGGPVTTAADTQLVFDNGTTEVSNTVISGAGALTKNGNGLLVMNNANSFTGGTVINSGRVGLNNGLGLGTGDVVVLQNAILGIGGVNFANNVSGAGQIIKTANNVAVMTGTNTHSGGTDIQQGGIIVNSPAALGTGAVSLSGANTTLTVNYSGTTNVALNNQINGVGTLIKDGSGTVVMNASGNSYSGGTLISAGRLGLNFGDSLGTGIVQINSGAELALGDITFSNNVQGAGQIIKTSAGATTLSGTNTHSGGISILGGSLNVTGSGALGSGTVNIAAGAALNYTNTNAVTFANGLSGSGSFNKLGTGQLSFANNFALGSLNLQAGRTRMNVVGTTNVIVGANATLDGTGRIIGNLTNNGTIAPGNSIGTLTVQGNYTHNANSVLEIEFDGAGNIDLLDVTGNATLNGGTLRFVSIGGAEGQGGTFLRTGGTLSGTFATVETIGAQLPLAVIYQTNSAFMAPSVLTARPSTFNAQSMAAADSALGFVDSIGIGVVRHGEGNRIWLNGFGAWGKRSASGTTLAYDHDTRGTSGGINFDAGSNVTLGAAFGWAKGDITLGANGGGGEQSSLLGSLHARYSGTGFVFGGGLLFGKVDQDTTRNVSFNGFAASVDGSTDSKIFGGFAELGVPLGSTGGWAFSAQARGSYVRQTQDAYSESGTSPLRLSIGELKTNSLEGQAKLTAKTSLWDRSNGGEETPEGLDLRINLGARYLGALGDREIPVTFAASNAGIVLQGDTRDSLQGLFGVALDYTIRNGATFSIGYRGEVGQTDRHAVHAGVSFAF